MWLTNPTEPSPSRQANSSSAAQEIPCNLRSLSFITAFKTSCHMFHFVSILFNITLSSTPRPSKWSKPYPFPYVLQDPPVSFFLILSLEIRLVKSTVSRSSTLHNLLHSPFTTSALGLNIFFRTLFSDTVNPFSSSKVADQVSSSSSSSFFIILLLLRWH